jgi:Spy/CpxP family protein refolding chaperone
MKRFGVSFVIMGVWLSAASAAAAPLVQSPQDAAEAQRRLQEAEAAAQRLANTARELERVANLQGRGVPGAVPGQRGGGASVQVPVLTRQNIGAWWTNANVVTRLGLTDDQKAGIERAFENHRQSLASSTELLEKEEVQLGKLLAADPLERNAVHSQIDKVVQARSEMERTNAAMMLEMREQLTLAQWTQLQSLQPNLGGLRIRTPFGDQLAPPAPPSPPPPGGGPTVPGQRGGRRGGAGQQ